MSCGSRRSSPSSTPSARRHRSGRCAVWRLDGRDARRARGERRRRRRRDRCDDADRPAPQTDVRRAVGRVPALGPLAARLLSLAPALTDPLPIPMALTANMRHIADDPDVARIVRRDRRGGGNVVSARFLRSWFTYRPEREVEALALPVLLVHRPLDPGRAVGSDARALRRACPQRPAGQRRALPGRRAGDHRARTRTGGVRGWGDLRRVARVGRYGAVNFSHGPHLLPFAARS